MRYLPVSVYSNNSYGDCSNNGVTFTNPDNLVVPCSDGFLTEVDVATNGYIKLEVGEAGNLMHFKPVGLEGWTMMGGNFVYSSDSRFIRTYGPRPISVHDRVER